MAPPTSRHFCIFSRFVLATCNISRTPDAVAARNALGLSSVLRMISFQALSTLANSFDSVGSCLWERESEIWGNTFKLMCRKENGICFKFYVFKLKTADPASAMFQRTMWKGQSSYTYCNGGEGIWISAEQRYECVLSNPISIMRGWLDSNFPKNTLRNT